MIAAIQRNVRRSRSVRQLEDSSLWKIVLSCNSHLRNAAQHVLHAAMVLLLQQQVRVQARAASAMMRNQCSSVISDMRLHLVMVLGRSEAKRSEKNTSMLTDAREGSGQSAL
jgi:hypothetical protein